MNKKTNTFIIYIVYIEEDVYMLHYKAFIEKAKGNQISKSKKTFLRKI